MNTYTPAVAFLPEFCRRSNDVQFPVAESSSLASPNYGRTRYEHERIFRAVELAKSSCFIPDNSGSLLQAARSTGEHVTWMSCEPKGIHERLSRPAKIEPLFGGTISEEASRYNRPRHFGKAALAVMEAYAKDASEPEEQ